VVTVVLERRALPVAQMARCGTFSFQQNICCQNLVFFETLLYFYKLFVKVGVSFAFALLLCIALPFL
jgi:hypothetical protein